MTRDNRAVRLNQAMVARRSKQIITVLNFTTRVHIRKGQFTMANMAVYSEFLLFTLHYVAQFPYVRSGTNRCT